MMSSVAAFLLALVGAGFNETYGLLQLAALAGLLVTRYRSRVVLAAFTGAVLGMALVLLAPGNAVRTAQLDLRIPIMDALRYSVQVAFRYLIDLAINAPLAAALTVCVGWFTRPLTILPRYRLRWILGTLLAGFALAVLSCFPTIWATNAVIARMYVFPALSYLIALFVLGAIFGSRRRQSQIPATN